MIFTRRAWKFDKERRAQAFLARCLERAQLIGWGHTCPTQGRGSAPAVADELYTPARIEGSARVLWYWSKER